MNPTKILFIIDELEYKWFEDNKLVTNFWLIKEFLKREYIVEITTKTSLFVANSKGQAICNRARLRNDGEIVYEKEKTTQIIELFDIVFFRPDPPVDVNYINACNIFEFVNKENTVFLNDPLAIRNFNEKMHVNHFPDLVPSNLVTSSKELILDFVKRYERAVIKPLNRCFGSGVFLLHKHDANISSIIATATENGKTSVMVQEYLEGAKYGDKRVLIIGNKVLDECIRKLPAENDFKFAEHTQKYFEKSPLTKQEIEVAQEIANKLSVMGLPLVGLDMIDSKVIEINVTSPCYFIKEINELYNLNFEDKVIAEIIALCQQKSRKCVSV